MKGGDSGPAVELSFCGRQTLREMLAAALPACRALALPADDAARLSILVEELLANIVEHGGLAADGTIRLSVHREERGLRLVLRDSGQPFDPRDASLDADVPERGGGAGLDIVRRWAAILSYRPGPPLNRLELRIPFGDPRPPARDGAVG